MLDVIGANFGRTGTYSLKVALDMLGFGPCHHMYEVRQSPRQIGLWDGIARGAQPDWDDVFQGFGSQVDWPASAWWKDLARHYPEAKVILTVRDPESWYDSISKTILMSSTIGRTQDPDPTGRIGSDIIYRIVLEGIFRGRLTDKAYAIDVFNRHQQEVIESLPPERLLVYDVHDQWDPLCAFLGVDVPDAPFPEGNSVADFRARKGYL